MVKSEIRRGDIVFVADNQQHSPHDFIIYGNHPAVVVQNNVGNAYSQNLVVAFVTSSLGKGTRVSLCIPRGIPPSETVI